MHLLWILLLILLSLQGIIVIHELGHALFAKLFNVRIHSIIIGFGPKLFQSKAQKPNWIFALFPIGGSVDLLNSRYHGVTKRNEAYSFDKKPVWIRIGILVGGAAANLSFAFLALFIYFIIGHPEHPPVIKKINPSSLAWNAHLRADDKIISFANQPVESWQEVGMNILIHLGQYQVPLLVQHAQGQNQLIHMDLILPKHQKSANILSALGVEPNLSKALQEDRAGQNYGSALSAASKQILDLIVNYSLIIKQIVLGHIPLFCLIGPISFFVNFIHSFLMGLAMIFFALAHLSVAMALTNLLPIPSFDGGLILYALLEKIRGKPISIAAELLLHRLVNIGLCVLFAQLLANDLSRL